MIALATDWNSVRSSVEICSAGRTKIAPGRSGALRLDAGRDEADDLILERLPVAARSSFQITRSTASPFRRQ